MIASNICFLLNSLDRFSIIYAANEIVISAVILWAISILYYIRITLLFYRKWFITNVILLFLLQVSGPLSWLASTSREKSIKKSRKYSLSYHKLLNRYWRRNFIAPAFRIIDIYAPYYSNPVCIRSWYAACVINIWIFTGNPGGIFRVFRADVWSVHGITVDGVY